MIEGQWLDAESESSEGTMVRCSQNEPGEGNRRGLEDVAADSPRLKECESDKCAVFPSTVSCYCQS